MRVCLFFFIITILSCAPKGAQKSKTVEGKIINEAIEAHGGKLYDNAHYAFEFRNKQYSFKHGEGRYEYTSLQEKNDRKVHYYMSNDQFTYSVNDEVQNLSDLDVTRYGNSLNSVIYFALLPYRLNDPAVNKAYKGITTIKDKVYEVVEVRFQEDGGGTDHDDVYYYWINQKTKTVDYLAYTFHVNGGGIRFRAAYNPRIVGGIRFQDYENYSADKDDPIAGLPKQYEAGSLKLLSKIELVNIRKMERSLN